MNTETYSFELSVVIPTHNRVASLQRTLAFIFQQELAAGSFEVVVVDDGSTDGTFEWLQTVNPRCGWKVLHTPNGGPAAARNRGIEASSGEIVLFMDDDISCPPGLLSAHLEGHRKQAAPSVVYGPLRLEGDSSALSHSAREFLDLHRENSEAADSALRQAYVGPNRSVRRHLLKEYGGFDELFRFVAEDRELGVRLWAEGVPFVSCPVAAATHHYDCSSSEFLEHIAGAQGDAEVTICRNHPGYRRYSSLAKVGRRSWKDKIYAAAARGPFDPAIALVEKVGESVAGLHALGARAFELRQLGRFMLGAATKCGSWESLEEEFGRGISCLMYHNVSRRNGFGDWNVPPDLFRDHMRALADEGYQAIGIREWLDWVLEAKPLPERPIILSFDDGYGDLCDNVFPLLEELKFKAVVYIVTGQIGGRNQWDIEKGFPEVRLLSADEIVHAAKQGIEFGSHSRSHRPLTSLNDDELRTELGESASTLAALTGNGVLSFAYPHGRYDQRVLQEVRKHYPSALCSDYGLASLASDLHRIERNPIWSNSSVNYVLRVAKHGNHPRLTFRAIAGRAARKMGLR
jgi:glycosyltransferase involved in cell wall biosynthesis/peptidoglycan/xylan/chitin deacetylase (PgdA/CDA1 family)